MSHEKHFYFDCFSTQDSADLSVVTRERVWREVMSGQRSAVVASMSGDLQVSPGLTHLSTFFSYFDTEVV